MEDFKGARVMLTKNQHLPALEIIDLICKRENLDHEDNLIMLQGRINRVQESFIRNSITNQDYNIQLNQISDSILLLIGRIEQSIKSENNNYKPILEPRFDEFPELDNLEKIINGNTLRDIHWLASGIKSSSIVCRITVKDIAAKGFGTGFLIDKYLITNNHVLPTIEISKNSFTEFFYEAKPDGTFKNVEICRINPDNYFFTNKEYDITIVELETLPADVESKLISTREPTIGEFISIIQHPSGGPKKIVTNGSRLTNKLDHKIQYTTDTLPGSSGSPIFDDEWEIIGIHHAGGNLKIDKLGNRKFINQGIKWSSIFNKFKTELPLTIHKTAIAGKS